MWTGLSRCRGPKSGDIVWTGIQFDPDILYQDLCPAGQERNQFAGACPAMNSPRPQRAVRFHNLTEPIMAKKRKGRSSKEKERERAAKKKAKRKS